MLRPYYNQTAIKQKDTTYLFTINETGRIRKEDYKYNEYNYRNNGEKKTAYIKKPFPTTRATTPTKITNKNN